MNVVVSVQALVIWNRMRDNNAGILLKPTRFEIIIWIVAVVSMLVLALRDWNNYVIGVWGDEAAYVILAESLVKAKVYGYLYLPGGPDGSQYPFGMPMILTPLVVLFPGQYDVLRLVPLAATILNLSLLFWGWSLLGGGFSYRWGTALTLLVAFSPLTIMFARVLMSEAVFLSWGLGAMLLVENCVRRPVRGWGIWFGIVAVGVAYTRTVGWVVLAGLVIYLVLQLRERSLRPLLVAAFVMAALLGVVVALTPVRPLDLIPSDYVSQISNTTSKSSSHSGAPQNFFQNRLPANLFVHLDITDLFPYRIENEIKGWSKATGVDLQFLPALCLALLMSYGSLLWYRASGLTAFSAVLPMYLVTLVIWVWDGSRLFYPVQPQIIFVLMLSLFGLIRALYAKLPQSAGKWFTRVALASVGILLGSAMLLVNLRTSSWFSEKESRQVYAEWVKENTPSSAVFMSLLPPTDYLYTRRTFVPFRSRWRTSQDLLRFMREQHVTYVIGLPLENPLDRIVAARGSPDIHYYESLRPLITRGILVPVYTRMEADTAIYKVDPARIAQEPD